MSIFATLQQEWEAKYRVPVSSFEGSRLAGCIAMLAVPDETSDNIWGFLTPDEADAKLVALYIDYYETIFYPAYVRKMREAGPVDIDLGTNTITFAKVAYGWGYNKATWDRGPVFAPTREASEPCPTLLSVMDRALGYGSEPNPKWEAFKAEHGL